MVNLLGEKIRHKTLGIGEVISVEGNYITIKFPSKKARFAYPSAFEKYLSPEENKIADAVNADLAMAIEVEAKKKAEEKVQKAKEEWQQQNIQQEKKNKTKAGKSISVKSKYVIKKTRGKSLKYLLFQDEYYEEECKGQFIRIQGIKKDDGTVHYRDPLFDVISGDIIFHCVKGYVGAISIVKNKCFKSVHTDYAVESIVGDDSSNLKIDCEYHVLENPVKYNDNIIKKYTELNTKIDENKGYLFSLDNKLAYCLLKDVFDKNSFLKSITIMYANLDGMPVITSKDDLLVNCKVLDEYIESRRDPEYSYALDLIKRGICFVAIKTNGDYKFYPSRFVGYKNNSRLKHMNNRWRDGRETNPAISYVLKKGEPLPNIELEVLYREYCERLGFEAMDKGSFGNDHKYWEM